MSILSSNVLANEKNIYLGVDILSSGNTFHIENKNTGKSIDSDVNSKAFKLKFGTVMDDNLRVQAYYQHETYKETLYDETHDLLNEVGLDLIKGFEVTPKFLPFLQVGLGYGWMNVDGYSNRDTVNEISLKIGAGLMYQFTNTFEGIVGFDAQYRNWTDIEIYGQKALISETSRRLYIGVNIHF
jgi:opacity protein-like surface antigen